LRPTDLNWAVVLLFLIGKLGITSSFGVIVVYTAELYPTAMRSIGVGTSSTVARVGAMLAPFVPLLVSLRTAHCAPSSFLQIKWRCFKQMHSL
jgi:OCT family organic cation transporter-like MFS transporter 4/5